MNVISKGEFKRDLTQRVLTKSKEKACDSYQSG
ncbi:hypothetical protein VAA_04254 [Vibrio anguillarum 775]|nr:hypothetical protein VAA_04254 [Vibrio anguillarum 775]